MNYQIATPTFVAGVKAVDGHVVEADPIVRRQLIGVSEEKLFKICKRHKWTLYKWDRRVAGYVKAN